MLAGRRYLCSAIGLSLVVLTGCDADWDARGLSRTESRSVPLDKSEQVRAELKMGAGELHVQGGATGLMDAEFSYNRLRMRPEVHYDATGLHGDLTVEEPAGMHGGNSRYRWDVRLNDSKPLDLTVDFGAGEGRLDIGELNLRSVDIRMGVGQLRIDLRGMPKNDYRLSLRGGVGEATIYLPEGVGIAADARGGIGGIQARGLEKRGGRYVNDAYGHAKTTVELDIRGGIGSINLIGG